MAELADQSCKPLSGPGAKLTAPAVEGHMASLPGWVLAPDGLSISRDVRLKTFMAAVEFVNAVAAVAEKEGHHPDISINYRKVGLTLSTHDSGGLTMNDMVMAAKLNRLIAKL